MHKIKRTGEPKSLKKNKDQWTKELLKEVENKGIWSEVDVKYKSHYRQKDVLSSLISMTNETKYCFFCELPIGGTDYPNIEHYKPKSNPDFHHLCFEWDNLLLACEKCNKKKGSKWNYENPILNPCDDEIEDHLKFDCWRLKPLSKRAVSTIEQLQLNDKGERKDLIDSRFNVWVGLISLIELINDTTDEVEKYNLKKKLEEYVEERKSFAGLISFTVKNLLK